MSRNILRSSFLSAILNISFQIFCRLLTFGINIFMVRNIGRSVLGIINVRLLLLDSTIIFLTRESISRASLSTVSAKELKQCSWGQLISHQWLTLPICVIISIICVQLWLYIMMPIENPVQRQQYFWACYCMSLACLIEFFAEAPVFVSQVFCFVKLKVIISTLQILVRSCLFLWLVYGTDGSWAILSFALAQLTSALTVVMAYYGFYSLYIRSFNKFKKSQKREDVQIDLKYKIYENMEDFPFKNIFDFLPGVMLKKNENFINKNLLQMTKSFAKQTFVKQILTEGEKYVMSLTTSLTFSEQATYDIVNNLGSMAARFIFRPIEDSAYFYFTQTVARDVALKEQKKNKIAQASLVLKSLLATITAIGLMALTFGQNYSHSLLYLYGGPQLVSDNLPEKLLRCHCVAIYFLAINGITEGYMFATNTITRIDKYNYVMGIFSIVFILMSILLTHIFGAVGFIMANCVNMSCRIYCSCQYIRKQYTPVGDNPLLGLIPTKTFTIILVFAFLCCSFLKHVFSLQLHLLVGVICAIVTVLIWIWENKTVVEDVWSYKKSLKKYN